MKSNEVLVFKTEPSYQSLEKVKNEIQSEYLDKVLDIVMPGNRVVIKPNFVKEHHMYKPDEWEYVITHPIVIKLVLEGVIKRLDGKGEIYVVDAPQTDSDYDKIMDVTGLPQILKELQKNTTVKLEHFDLRDERWFYKEGIIVKRKRLPGDPKGYVHVNLREKSEFNEKECKDYYGADYDMEETKRYHNDKDNIYVMSKTVLSADVFI